LKANTETMLVFIHIFLNSLFKFKKVLLSFLFFSIFLRMPVSSTERTSGGSEHSMRPRIHCSWFFGKNFGYRVTNFLTKGQSSGRASRMVHRPIRLGFRNSESFFGGFREELSPSVFVCTEVTADHMVSRAAVTRPCSNSSSRGPLFQRSFVPVYRPVYNPCIVPGPPGIPMVSH